MAVVKLSVGSAAYCRLGGLREAPAAFTCTSCVSLATSVIRSASVANSSMSVFEDVARIRRTSGGS